MILDDQNKQVSMNVDYLVDVDTDLTIYEKATIFLLFHIKMKSFNLHHSLYTPIFLSNLIWLQIHLPLKRFLHHGTHKSLL